MTRFTMFGLALFTLAVLAVAPAPTAKADGLYGGAYTSGRAYWDPACGCWVYPTYSYYPSYTFRPTYSNYSYPRSYSPYYYSRPSFSVGFSFGGGRQYGGYGRRRSYR